MSTLKVGTIADTSGSNGSTPAAIANGIAKAWVNFNGTGTVAIRASYNVSSITDNGTGDYTVNFTNALVDANYSSTFISTSAQSIIWSAGNGGANPTTTAFRVASRSSGGSQVDAEFFSASIFR